MASEGESKTSEPQTTDDTIIHSFLSELFSSYLNVSLLVIIVYLTYKILVSFLQKPAPPPVEEKPLPKLRRDFTVQELKGYDGTGQDGRVLVALNGKVFDVTKGRRFYGPGGPYAAFGGKDATRGLATFSVTCSKDEYDDISDLTPMEMDSVREWETQFREKYDYVGKLLKPGETHTNYSDEEEESAGGGDQEKNKSD